MAIDRSGRWWRGDHSGDIDEYLREFSADGYPVTRTVPSRCAGCGGSVFRIRADDEEGCVERTCLGCSAAYFMLDSEEYAEDAELDAAECPCGGGEFEVAVGFAFFEDGDVRWVYVGLRCTSDGVLGCYADWKIDYSPSTQLLERS